MARHGDHNEHIKITLSNNNWNEGTLGYQRSVTLIFRQLLKRAAYAAAGDDWTANSPIRALAASSVADLPPSTMVVSSALGLSGDLAHAAVFRILNFGYAIFP